MRHILIILFLSSSLMLFSQEEYYVIQVKGTIRMKSSGQVIKQGDHLKPSDQLVFVTPDAVARLVSRAKGRFIIKPKQAGQLDLSAIVSDCINDYLKLSQGNLSTRDVFSCNANGFTTYLEKKPFLLIGDTAYIRNCKNLYNMADNNFFFLQYQFPPGEFQTIKLETENNRIKIIRNSAFMVDGKPVNPDEVQCELGYGKEGRQPARVSSFHPRLISGPELKATLVNYLDYTGYSKLPEKQQIDSIVGVVRDFYGTPDDTELLTWLKKNMNLTYPEK